MIAGGREHQSCRRHDQSGLHIGGCAGSLDALADDAKIVTESDLPLDRSLVQVVGSERRVRRFHNCWIQAEAFSDVLPSLNRLTCAAPAAAPLTRLEQPED